MSVGFEFAGYNSQRLVEQIVGFLAVVGDLGQW